MSTNLFNPADKRSYPARWPLIRGKQLFQEIDERSKDGTEELLSVSHITGITPRSQKNVTMFQAESLVGYKLCKIGDIAANTMWTWQGAIGVSKFAGVVSPAYNVYRPKSDIFNPQYLDMLLRERQLVDVYHSLSTGIRPSRLRLYPDVFLTIKLPVPPREEQDQIVRFLDWKVSSINKLINIKKNMIALLENRKKSIINGVLAGGASNSVCKESVIEGLLTIPTTWDERPLKFYASSNDESLSSRTPSNYEFNYIDISTTGFRKLKKEPVCTTFEEAPSRARRIVREGDTILSTVRTYLKAILYIDNTKDGNVVSTGFAVLRPKDGVYPPLLSYALSCDYFINAVIRYSIGISYPAINDKKLLSLKLALPKSYDEQVKVYEQIKALTESTDITIEYLRDMVNGLQDLKARLISDTVTGKIDVRGIDIPEYEFVDEDTDTDNEDDGEEETEEQEGAEE